MVRESEIREGELAVEMPKTTNAGLVFIGRIRTPWTSRLETPRQGRHDGPVCRLEIFEPWVPALKGVDFQQSRSDLLAASVAPRSRAAKPEEQQIDPRHVFAALAGAPNPIGTSTVKLVGIEGMWCWCAASIASTRRRSGYQARPLRIHPAGACGEG
jgi:tRNA (Thr-GGU) A37 N-methylase